MREADPFLHPVDPGALGLPDYFKIVEKPMDLGTIDKRLRQKGVNAGPPYTNVEDLVKDVHLVVENCYKFNGPDHAISAFARKVEETFDSNMANLPPADVSFFSGKYSAPMTDVRHFRTPS